MRDLFTRIYDENLWGSPLSRSGPGSTLARTGHLRVRLRELMDEYGVRSMLDIPCGDYNWMREVDMGGVDYVGVDVVEDLIVGLKEYEREGVRFGVMDVTRDRLADADLLFMRDCLVHFSLEDALEALRNIGRSRYRYVMMTTFPIRQDNVDARTGSWRPLNMMLEPFNFPRPLKVVMEGNGGVYFDKAMGLWDYDSIFGGR